MRRLALVASALAFLGITGNAEAADSSRSAWPENLPRAGPLNAISFYPLALAAWGFAAEYERFIAPRRWSFAVGLGATHGVARGDYRSDSLTPSLELRFWLTGRGPFAERADRGMVGSYLSFREETQFTATTDEVRGHFVGSAVELGSVLSFGYRITAGPFIFTPSHGAAVLTQLDPSGRLAATTTVAIRLALAVGVLF